MFMFNNTTFPLQKQVWTQQRSKIRNFSKLLRSRRSRSAVLGLGRTGFARGGLSTAAGSVGGGSR